MAVKQPPKAIFVFCLFALAFALRAVFAIQWHDMPYGKAPLLDAQIYDQWAWDLANGGGAVNHAYYQSPLYPYLLSLVYRVAGHSYLAASFLNILLDCGTVTLLGLISFSLFGPLAGILTGLLGATYAPMIFYTASPMKEPLVLFLLTLFLFFSLRALRSNKLYDYGLAGLVFGLAALTRGNVLLLAPVLPVMAWARYKTVSLRGAGVFIAALILAMLPVNLHNYRTSHVFVPVTYADGFNLYIGHSPYANGTNAYPPEVSTGPEQERLDTTLTAEQEAGHALNPAEISSFWRARAIAFALHNPGRELLLLARKFLAFWNGGDSFDNYDMRFIRVHFPSLLNGPLAGFWLVAPLAMFSLASYLPLASSPRRRGSIRSVKLDHCLRGDDARGIMLLSTCAVVYMAAVLIFYVTDRYRLPVVVFLLPLAGAAIPVARDLIAQKNTKRLAGAGIVATIFLGLALAPQLDDIDLSAFDWGVLTATYADKNENDRALEAFQKGRAISETQIGAQAYIHAADIYEKRGQLQTANDLIEKAVTLFPQDGVALYNRGRMQALRGEIGPAIKTMQQAKQLAPAYGLIYFALAELYKKQHNDAEAQAAIDAGLAIDPDNPRLLALKNGF